MGSEWEEMGQEPCRRGAAPCACPFSRPADFEFVFFLNKFLVNYNYNIQFRNYSTYVSTSLGKFPIDNHLPDSLNCMLYARPYLFVELPRRRAYRTWGGRIVPRDPARERERQHEPVLLVIRHDVRDANSRLRHVEVRLRARSRSASNTHSQRRPPSLSSGSKVLTIVCSYSSIPSRAAAPPRKTTALTTWYALGG